MKLNTAIKLLACVGLALAAYGPTVVSRAQDQPASQAAPKPQDTIVLATEAKHGSVTFSHLNHTTKNYNISGTGPVACVECHHTAQPASEVAKHPPLKSAWPADRTTTLTAELLAKDPNAVGSVTCRSCHARAGSKPPVWPEIPSIKHESSSAIVTLTNQHAFHRNCAGCHDEVAKNRKDVKAPTLMKCASCHKR